MSIHLPVEDEPLGVILKLPGSVCNINCHYCFEKRKPYDKYQKISPELLGRFLALAGNRSLALELHGGEPLIIGKDSMIELLRVCQGYPGALRIRLQTNGLLFDQEWIDIFKREWPSIELATSLDGDPISTRHRVDYRDRPTYEGVERALALLDANDMRIGISCTVTRQTTERPGELIDYFLQFRCLNLVKLNPCFDFNVASPMYKGNAQSIQLFNPSNQGIPGWAIGPRDFGRFLIKVFDIWVETGAYERLFIEPFMSIIRVLGGKTTNHCHYSEHKCANMLTLYPDGRIGSCDELRMPDALLTTVDDIGSLNDILHYQTNSLLHKSLDRVLEKCRSCDYKTTCNGGCLSHRLAYWGTPYYEQYCEHRIEVIDHISAYLSQVSVA